jgi:hypothetical protein
MAAMTPSPRANAIMAVKEALLNALHADNMRPEYYREINKALLSLPTIEGWRPLREVIKFGTKQRIWVWNKDIDEDGWYVAHVEADDTPALWEDYLDCPAIGIQTPEPPENGHD